MIEHVQYPRPLRVLAVCYEDPEQILGGMGMHVRELYRTMAEQGVKIDLITQGEPEGSEEYLGFTKHYDDKHICFKPTKPDFACRLMSDLQMVKTAMRLVAGYGQCYWDVLHIHEWSSVYLGRALRRALSIPVVGTMHLCLTYLGMTSGIPIQRLVTGYSGLSHPIDLTSTNPAEWGDADKFMMQQEGNLLCDPDEVILCSNSYIEMVRKQFMIERPINMIYNGINTKEWNPDLGDGERARYDHGLDMVDGILIPRRPIALFCGRVAEMKGITYLIKALEEHDPGWQVVIAGEVNANSDEDRDKWWVTKAIRKLEKEHPERLRWVGFRHGQSLRDLYAVADCVIMPSVHEPFGIVALEAMAMGTPLIATEVDGLGEIVNGDDGREYAMIIPAGSSDAILAALKMLKSSIVRDELRMLGLERVKSFTWEAVAEQTIEVYRRAMAIGSRRAEKENECLLH
jgi:glycogen(starch) synthase